jgi:hypothetical protein
VDIVKQHVCRLSLSKLRGFRSFLEQLKFYTLVTFGHFKSFGGEYRVSYASTLKVTSRTLVRGSREFRHGKRF